MAQTPASYRGCPAVLVPERILADNVGTGTGFFFLQILRFSYACILPSVLHAHIHLHVTPARRTTEEAWEPTKKQKSSKSGSIE